MLVVITEIAPLLRCPRCNSALTAAEEPFSCSNALCAFSAQPFLVAGGQPVLIDFEESILDKAAFEARGGDSYTARPEPSFKSRIRGWFEGTNTLAAEFCDLFLADVKARSHRPRVLVIGGGAIGSGAEALYSDSEVELIGSDVYATENTTLVADGHKLPLASGCIDGVWIQAVLEHVLTPSDVVAEIHRVLKPDGVVFSDTPFMQQVHEGAYDFTRFTLSGHRWLFRDFAMIDAGYSAGPAKAFVWSAGYLLRALTESNLIRKIFRVLFMPVGMLEKLNGGRASADAASAVFFYGRKASFAINPKEMVGFYDMQLSMTRRRMVDGSRSQSLPN